LRSSRLRIRSLRQRAKKLKAKGKKDKTCSSSSEDGDSSFREEVSHKGRKERNKHDKPSYNSISFNYNNMPNSIAYIFVLIGKAPRFDGSNYNQWKLCMKNYLYSLHPEVWQIVCDSVDFSNEDEQSTPDQLQKIYHNAQAISVLTAFMDKEEFNHVNGLDLIKDVWNTLQMAHEVSNPVSMAMIEILEGKLNRFVMFDDEIPQDMFNRLKKMVNKAKALGSKKWTDHMLTGRLMKAYTPMNYNEKATIKRLGKELVVRDQFLEIQEDLLEQERQTTCELKELLKCEKEKNENLAQGNEAIFSLESSSGAIQDSYDIL
jgi:hypothetical protein